MTTPTFLVSTLGCKVNQVDGDTLSQLLLDHGFVRHKGDGAPTVFLLNGCAVTARASQKARQLLRSTRRRWLSTYIVLTGCEGTRALGDHPTPPGEVGTDPGTPLADMILAPARWRNEMPQLYRLLSERPPTARPDATPVTAPAAAAHPDHVHEPQAPDHDDPVDPAAPRTRGFLKVQDGCRHRCSYCIVPDLRGPERSVEPDAVLAEAARQVALGRRELVLTGVHLGRYAAADGSGLAPLLHRLDHLDGLERIRLSSLEPMEVDTGLLDWLRRSPRACHHLHLPLQAGHDEILAAMRRPYDTAEYRAVVERVRKAIPDIAITTDLIVGFPGEDEARFATGLTFVATLGFSRIHLFPFSPRPGTPAAGFACQVGNGVKRERMQRAEQVRRAASRIFHARFLGRRVEVLIERRDRGTVTGFSREYLPCRIADTTACLQTNTTVAVHITEIDEDECRAAVFSGH